MYSPSREWAQFGVLLLAWWAANNLYAVDAHLLFTRFSSNLLFIDLTFAQVFVGLAIGFITSGRSKLLSTEVLEAPTPYESIRKQLNPIFLTIAVCHFVGCLFTNLSYSVIGSTSTLMWKLTEPVVAVILKRIILKESTSTVAVLGMLTTLSGVLLFSKSSFSAIQFSPIILANLVFPTRNVLIKLSERRLSPDQLDPKKRFINMLMSCLPLCTVCLFGKVVMFGTNFGATWYLVRNALFFNTYMFASFALLARLDALTHSLLNTVKRCTGILFSMFIIQTPLQSNHFEGLGMTTVGFLVYLFGTKYKAVKYAKHTTAVAVVTALFLFLFSVSHYSNVRELKSIPSVSQSGTAEIRSIEDTGDTFINDTTTSQQAVAEAINTTDIGTSFSHLSPAATDQTTKKYIIQTIGDYSTFRREVKFTSYYEGIGYATGNEHNLGNLIWQYGAFVSLPDFSNVTLCKREEAEADSCRDLPDVPMDAQLIQYRAQANSISASEPDRFATAYELLENTLDGLVVVGLGVQAPLQRNWSKPAFQPGWKVTYNVSDFSLSNMTTKFFRRVEEKESVVLFRGDFSYAAAKLSGSDPGYAVGCPSLWINEDVHMGESLQKRYQALARRVGDKSVKVAVNLSPIPGYEKHIIYFRDHYPNARFYSQCSWDMAMLNKLKVPFERVRYFTNAEDWMKDLSEMDLSYGPRIHGNMVSLSVGLPVLVIAPDYRVLDLVERMLVPHTTVYDGVFDGFESGEFDVVRIVSGFGGTFDGGKFDRNRCEIAKVYMDVFGRFGFGVRRHVQEVGSLC